MKKLILVIACFGMLTIGVNALSIGVGGDYGSISTKMDTENPNYNHSVFEGLETSHWGIFGFVDWAFLEAHLGIKTITESIPSIGSNADTKYKFFDYGLKLKLPLTLMERLTVFPLAGVDYLYCRSVEGTNKYTGSPMTVERGGSSDTYLDQIALNVGAGADFFLGQTLFIRGEFNWVFLLNSDLIKDACEEVKTYPQGAGYEYSISQRGPAFKLAIGYRLP